MKIQLVLFISGFAILAYSLISLTGVVPSLDSFLPVGILSSSRDGKYLKIIPSNEESFNWVTLIPYFLGIILVGLSFLFKRKSKCF